MSCCGLTPCWKGIYDALQHLLFGRRAFPKTLFLVRHGESTYNVYHEVNPTDPLNMWDAPLTSLGETQARCLEAAFLARPPVDLAVSSPLSRAMRTCLLAVPSGNSNSPLRYEVTPLLSEKLEASCDVGRPPSELASEFPEFDLTRLPEVWWYVPEEFGKGITPESSRRIFAESGRRESRGDFDRRVDRFARWLANRDERNIALFAHADFFNTFLRRHFAKKDVKWEDYWMKNCEVVTLTVESADDLKAPTDAEDAPTAGTTVSEAAVAPSAPASSAALAIAALKEEIRLKYPDLKPGQLAKEAALRWKTFTPEERTRYMASRT
mmetsp:Transcript_61766/g.147351  ORF Transcript_61766/g.147351 Transcript_61766/m.147351 type:complete len:324 (-) Transcript_61766:1-972(-)